MPIPSRPAGHRLVEDSGLSQRIAAQTLSTGRNQAVISGSELRWTGGSFNLATKDQPEYVEGQLHAGFYRMMGVKFLYGRDFLPEEGVAGKDHVVCTWSTSCEAAGIRSQHRRQATPD